MEPVSWRPGFAPPATPLTRRLLVYFRSGAYTFITLLLVPVLYSIAVLDLKIVKWR